MKQIDVISDLSLLKQKKLYILDLDGTIYIENHLIDGALEFVENVQKHGAEVLFLTNNSSLGTSDYVNKISSLGFCVSENNILTSGFSTGLYIKEKYSRFCNLYVVGTDAFKRELISIGHTICDETTTTVDCVVVGFDTELTYSKILASCKYIENGVEFIATNPDLVCPVANNRFIPDCGSMYKMLQNATGREPFVVGKPNRVMGDIISRRFSLPPSDMVMIGDRLYTDIAFGINSSITSICVLTGESTIAMVKSSPWKPAMVISSIDFLNRMF